MHYADRPGKSAVERFMQFYFLNAKTVGDLTGVFLAQLDEQLGKKGFRFALADDPPAPQAARRVRARPRADRDPFRRFLPRRSGAPDRAVRASRRASSSRSIPSAMRAATRDAALIDRKLRDDPRANALFMEVLTCVQSSRAGAALDERGRRVRPLRSRLRPGRRADAVRHVPPLYGRRAFDPRDRAAGGDRARRVEGRSSAVDRDHPEADRVAAGALCRGPAARHRQGPRRRP